MPVKKKKLGIHIQEKGKAAEGKQVRRKLRL
jgi:hypothetical protein